MGLFDRIDCHFPLPDGRTADDFDGNLEFQTKSLNCTMSRYRITREGELQMFRYELQETGNQINLVSWAGEKAEPVWVPETVQVNERWERFPHLGRINFYAMTPGGEWCEYIGSFIYGQLAYLSVANGDQVHPERKEILEAIKKIEEQYS